MTAPLTRREFASWLTIGSVVPGMAACAADPAKKSDPDTPAPVAVDPVDLILSVIRQQYPHDRFDDAALEEVRTDILQNSVRSQILSSYPLTNANEPGFIFSAWRADQVRG